MNKLFACLFAFILLISSISAVSISPQNPTINQQIATTQEYNLTITNDQNFTIQNFTFSDLFQYGFNFPNIEIPANSQKTINYSVNPQITANQQIRSNVEFRYEVNISEEITTYNIDYFPNQNGFDPLFLVVRKGDSVNFKNNDDITHDLEVDLTHQTIHPNQTYTHTFNELGTFEFSDPIWSAFSYYNGQIEVIERTQTQLVHDPNLDLIWNLNLQITDKPTQLETELTETFFEIDALSQTEGLIRIKNIGNQTANNVKITSDSNWISPSENDFSLNPNQQKFVDFEISPIIVETADTNKNYTIKLTVKGINTDPIIKEIIVFIPFNDDFDDPDSGTSTAIAVQKAIEKYIEFCSNNPDKCGGGNQTSQDQNQGNFTFNASAVDIEKILKKQGFTESEISQIRESLGIQANTLQTTLKDVLNQLNQILQDIRESKDTSDTFLVLLFIGLFLFTGIFVTNKIVNIIEKRRKEKNMIEEVKWRGEEIFG